MMSAGKRFIWALAMAAFLTMTSGCATTNLRLVEDEMARPGTGLYEDSGQQINGYVLSNGTKEEYKGYARFGFFNNRVVYLAVILLCEACFKIANCL